jgi:hypothetical protein
MRVPVLVVLPATDPLRNAAVASIMEKASAAPLTSAALPEGIELDPTFPPVAIGTGRPQDVSVAGFEAAVSESFTVRGFIETDAPDEIPEEVGGRPVFSDPRIEPFVTCGGTQAVGNAAAVRTSLQVAQLAARGLDGDRVAIVIMDTGINLAHLTKQLGSPPRFDAANSWTPPGGTTAPGRHPVDHGTMCAFDALIAAPRATLVDFPILSTSAPGGSVFAGTLNIALQAYARLLSNWAVSFTPGTLSGYNGLVVSNSWGMFHPSWDFPAGHRGRYCDNPRHPFNLIVAALAVSGADIVFAAGNCGAQCADGRCQSRTTGTIMGASASDSVLTLAGCDTNDQRVGYSSQGPSISGMFQQKPDLTAYTHFVGSEAYGPGSPDSGTSTSCPVAAGCVAALRTRLSPGTTPPASLFAQLNATARVVGGAAGWNGDYGHGIIDPLAAATTLGL